jgi:molecular chaperone DnaK
VPAAERSSIEAKLKDLRAALEGEDREKLKRLSEELQNAFHALSQQLYAQNQPAGEAGPRSNAAQNGDGSAANGHDPNEGVVEGEFREA